MSDHVRVLVRRVRERLVHLHDDVVDEARHTHGRELVLDAGHPLVAIEPVVAAAIDELARGRVDSGGDPRPHAALEVLDALELLVDRLLPLRHAEHLLARVLVRFHLDTAEPPAAVHPLHHDAEGEARLLVELGLRDLVHALVLAAVLHRAIAPRRRIDGEVPLVLVAVAKDALRVLLVPPADGLQLETRVSAAARAHATPQLLAILQRLREARLGPGALRIRLAGLLLARARGNFDTCKTPRGEGPRDT
mmetsp:Transcript_7682/g.19600  ORF Transcript_7682/g.19600 Transcript_7682/m.19600 type:complete len:250 (+) Transcript_7682:711-1460(+)